VLALRSKGKKFFFDMNVFDENGMELRELEANKPPPAFSEEQIAAAKKSSFEKGKQEGFQESQNSIAQQVARTLKKVSQEAGKLFESEEAREKIFELESTRLALAVFEKLFPAYSAAHGLEELKAAIVDILQNAAGQSEIVIEVHPDIAGEIRKTIEDSFGANEEKIKFNIRENDAIGPENCRLGWADGGAVRDSLALAEKIRDVMEESLAAQGGNVHDSGGNNDKPAPKNAEAPEGGKPVNPSGGPEEPLSGDDPDE